MILRFCVSGRGMQHTTPLWLLWLHEKNMPSFSSGIHNNCDPKIFKKNLKKLQENDHSTQAIMRIPTIQQTKLQNLLVGGS